MPFLDSMGLPSQTCAYSIMNCVVQENEKDAIFKVLSIILHLGNVDFGRTEVSGCEVLHTQMLPE